jgi:hypothetical protein
MNISWTVQEEDSCSSKQMVSTSRNLNHMHNVIPACINKQTTKKGMSSSLVMKAKCAMMILDD